jgi:hypothetical protein
MIFIFGHRVLIIYYVFRFSAFIIIKIKLLAVIYDTFMHGIFAIKSD